MLVGGRMVIPPFLRSTLNPRALTVIPAQAGIQSFRANVTPSEARHLNSGLRGNDGLSAQPHGLRRPNAIVLRMRPGQTAFG